MPETNWTVAQVTAKFRESIEMARSRGPQTTAKNGRKAAIVASSDKRLCKTERIGTLADFFAASPLRNSGLKMPRSKQFPRPIKP